MMFPAKPKARPDARARAQAERSETLTGTRPGVSQEKRAATREDAAALGGVRLLSEKVTSAPTVAQHNALVDDIRALAATLNAMGAKFSGL